MSRTKEAGRGQAGFSYMEVLVAVVIVSVMAIVVLDWLIGAVTRTGRFSAHSAAAGWALGEVEYLRGQCFERLQPGRRQVTPGTLRQGEPPLPQGLGVADVVLEADGPALLRATVAVYGQDGGGRASSRTPILRTTTLIGDVRLPGQCP